MILAIDPGPTESAFVLYDEHNRRLEHRGWKGQTFGKLTNAALLEMVRTKGKHGDRGDVLVVEMIASYGMPVGREVFDTCVAIGQVIEAWQNETLREAVRLYRSAVKLHLCNSTKAKDGNVRQALIDAFGGDSKAIGKKKTPGPLYGVSGDVWAALGVAVTYADIQEQARSAA